MSILIESKKLKHSGWIPAFLGAGVVAALVPILNMAVRSENYVHLAGEPLQILLNANWDMIAMLNVLLIVTGACIMYHIEYEDRGFLKMSTLPAHKNRLFLGKNFLLTAGASGMLLLEGVSLGFCMANWFGIKEDFIQTLIKNTLYLIVLTLPAVMTMMIIAALFQNMWVSLGIGVICVFTATMLPDNQIVFSLFPFAMPFQTIYRGHVFLYIAAAITETAVFAGIGWIIEKIKNTAV